MLSMENVSLKSTSLSKQLGTLKENIQQREDLQLSALDHVERMVAHLLRSIEEANAVVKKGLSPVHIRRVLDYLREDIEPLGDLIRRISATSEQLGSLRREYELLDCDQLESSSRTSSSSHCEPYLLGQRRDKPTEKSPSQSPMYRSTPELLSNTKPLSNKSNVTWKEQDESCSTDSSVQVTQIENKKQMNRNWVIHLLVTCLIRLGSELDRLSSPIYLIVMNFKKQIRGRPRLVFTDLIVLIGAGLLLYYLFCDTLRWGWGLGRILFTSGRRIPPM